MVLMSIDSSSRKTGWAIFSNGEYFKSGVVNFDTTECKKKYKNDSFKRMKDMANEIIKIADYY